jgi:hypothetical protein
MNSKIGLNLSIRHAKQNEDERALAWYIQERVMKGDDMGMSKQELFDKVTWSLKVTNDL